MSTTVKPSSAPASPSTSPHGSTTRLCPPSSTPLWVPTALQAMTITWLSTARAPVSSRQCASRAAGQAAGTTTISAPASTNSLHRPGKRRS
ncbi:Uncharacterised protein [Mycobacteroides abscessus subsp. abscessus]|nr:Uncharacterised protein [Mycobacteroides abscessus subsp. abscessus]